MARLDFSNPVFHQGLNCTVRRGDKHRYLDTGTRIRLTGSLHNATVIATTAHTSIKSLPKIVFEFEHDPDCRNLIGLTSELDNVYGVGQWDKYPLTVIWFWV